MPGHAILLIRQMQDREQAAKVAAALERVEGVEEVLTDLNQNTVKVVFGPDQPGREALLDAVADAGFAADRIEVHAD